MINTMSITCEDVHWRLVELNVDHACGLASLLRIIGRRIGVIDVPDITDVILYNNREDILNALSGQVVVERALVPNLFSRAVLVGGVPYASIEDLVVSVVLNEDNPWYVDTVRRLLRIDSVREGLRWTWINEVLDRYGVRDRFRMITS